MNDRLHVATRKGLLLYERGSGGAGDWRHVRTSFLGVPVSAVLPLDDSGGLLAGLDHGHFGCKMQRSTDHGATWEEVAAPAYPPKPEGLDERCRFRGIEIPWSTKLIWTLEGGHPRRPERLWCGTIPGGLFRSDDLGTSWELVRELWDRPERSLWVGGGYDYAGIHSIALDPEDPDRLQLGVSCGGVWRSEDGGRSWAQSAHGMRADYAPPEQAYEPDGQDVHRLVQCPAAPERVWAQHHNGIFRSDDGGRNWTEIEGVKPSVFGFAAAVHPSDPDTAWFVPAVKDECRVACDGALCVNRTRDGGRTFEALRGGLPQEGAFDLVYRHGLAVDSAGETLAFGSTSGNLFVGDGATGEFHRLSGHLAPVTTVRFG